MASDQLKKIPGVDTLLNHPNLKEQKAKFGNELLTYSVRQVLHKIREGAKKGVKTPNEEMIVAQIKSMIEVIAGTSLKQVINATGIILHTNLGRAPLGNKILHALEPIILGYSNLEFNLNTGKRGKRADHIRELIKFITGAEDAIVVNNNAAGVSLTLRTFAEGNEVIISRGELIEIGGSFRLPEIMAASGAVMVEVGTTNRTRTSDYEKVISDKTKMILKAHKSNYYIDGFTEEVELGDLSQLANKHKLIFVYDIGSGLLKKMKDPRLNDEPDVRSSLQAGVDLITFSCDKLLGGPQAGIVAGKRKFISKLAKAPLMRTYRVDKMIMSTLSTVLKNYIKDEDITKSLPIFEMLARNKKDLESLANLLQSELRKYDIESAIEESLAHVGGGTVPYLNLNSYSVKVVVNDKDKKTSERIFYKLLKSEIPILGILRKGELHFDVLSLFQEDIPIIAKTISEVI